MSEETPQFRDIHIENVVCSGAKSAIMLQGLPEIPLRRVTLKHVLFASDRGVTVTDAENISFDHVRIQNRIGERVRALRVRTSALDLIP